jgi:hypothetical protein
MKICHLQESTNCEVSGFHGGEVSSGDLGCGSEGYPNVSEVRVASISITLHDVTTQTDST